MPNTFESDLADLSTLSAGAPTPGETAIFYSGMGTNGLTNLQNAGIVMNEAPGRFYSGRTKVVGDRPSPVMTRGPTSGQSP